MIQNENYPVCEMCGCAMPIDNEYCPSCGEDVLFAAPHFKKPVREPTRIERIILDLPPEPIRGWDDYTIYEPVIDDGSTGDSTRWVYPYNTSAETIGTPWIKEVKYQYQ